MKRIGLTILLVVILAACAPDNLDITPTPAATLPPTAVPTDTAAQADEAAAVADAAAAITGGQQAVLDAIIGAMPAQLPAGSVVWRRDLTRGENGIETPRNITNGVAAKIFYNEQVGGQSNITFGVFATNEDAATHYEFIKGIRPVLETGRVNADFSEPNLFGSGLYGSIAIFQIENVFVEVNIELFSSTQQNPLPSLSRGTLNIFESVKESLAEGS